MPAIELNASSTSCRKCGRAYGRLKGYFPVSYAILYKGTGYLPYCKDCVDGMYTAYLEECQDPKLAVRQMCRKLDLYWNEKLYEVVEKQNTTRSMMTSYIAKVNAVKTSGKSYDDTLREEGVLWVEPVKYSEIKPEPDTDSVETLEDDGADIPDEVIAFWGPGNSPSMYRDLEQRRSYWMSRFPDGTELDIGTEAIIRQICNLEIDINKIRLSGGSIDKAVNSLNTLLGSACLKPAQKKDSGDVADENTPFGVWIRRWEEQKPVPEPDPELKDVDGIVRYIQVWYFGHLCKMLKIKNSYSKMYEDELARLRVEHPECDDEDDETMVYDIFSNSGGDEE